MGAHPYHKEVKARDSPVKRLELESLQCKKSIKNKSVSFNQGTGVQQT